MSVVEYCYILSHKKNLNTVLAKISTCTVFLPSYSFTTQRNISKQWRSYALCTRIPSILSKTCGPKSPFSYIKKPFKLKPPFNWELCSPNEVWGLEWFHCIIFLSVSPLKLSCIPVVSVFCKKNGLLASLWT